MHPIPFLNSFVYSSRARIYVYEGSKETGVHNIIATHIKNPIPEIQFHIWNWNRIYKYYERRIFNKADRCAEGSLMRKVFEFSFAITNVFIMWNYNCCSRVMFYLRQFRVSCVRYAGETKQLNCNS